MWEFRNNDVHTNAETRRKLYVQGIFKEINIVKARASFCSMLTSRERRFINTPNDDLKRKSERGQLDWICRAEQFVSSTRLSKRLKLATGQYFNIYAQQTTHNVQQEITRYTTRTATEQQGESRTHEVPHQHNDGNTQQRDAKRQRIND